MARVYREAPLNSIWEGTANTMCLDVRRALRRDPACRQALFEELGRARGRDARFDTFVDRLGPLVEAMLADEFVARAATEAVARALQGAELLRHSSPEVVAAFMATRLGAGAAMFGCGGAGLSRRAADAIVDRARVIR